MTADELRAAADRVTRYLDPDTRAKSVYGLGDDDCYRAFVADVKALATGVEGIAAAERDRCAAIADAVFLEGYRDQGATVAHRIRQGVPPTATPD
jgi:hypothetical protein